MRTDPTARDALDEARSEILAAREAAEHGDHHRRAQYARSAIDSAATTLLDPSASEPEVVAARFFLHEAGPRRAAQQLRCGQHPHRRGSQRAVSRSASLAAWLPANPARARTCPRWPRRRPRPVTNARPATSSRALAWSQWDVATFVESSRNRSRPENSAL